ncbi:MAG: MgtC/SapB family protein [Rikenellaceae bacterium]|nr:MgtC/SapB family protein [Rikenellaceae bacterium]
MTIYTFATRLLLAFICGGIIGIERQIRQKNAGLRTNTLVALGSAAFILLSVCLTGTTGDPGRIASQIVTGVGFLGGGLILKDGFSVRGLNTAATIWCSASVGTFAGLGLTYQALIMVGFVIATHCLFRPLGFTIGKYFTSKEDNTNIYYSFRIRCKAQIENHIRVMMLNTISIDPHLQLRSLKSCDDDDPAYSFIKAEIFSTGKHDIVIEKLAAKLTIEYGVTQVNWEINGHCEE